MKKLTKKHIEKVVHLMFGDEYVGGFHGDESGRWCGFTDTDNASYLAEIYEDDIARIIITVYGEFDGYGDNPNLLAAYYHGMVDGICSGSDYTADEVSDNKVEVVFEWSDDV